MKPDTIRQIIRECPEGMDQAEWISLKIDEARKVRSRIAWIREVKRKAEAKWEEAREAFAQDLAAIRKACPHYDVDSNYGPEGRWDQCESCGETLEK
jgi:hypothetical protein